MNVNIYVADSSHVVYAEQICELVYISAQERGTGIAKRTPEYIAGKMQSGKAVIALEGKKLAGFAYIETWSKVGQSQNLRPLQETLSKC